MQSMRCGLLLQTSYVARSVCLSVSCALGWAVHKRLNRSICRLGLTYVGLRNHALDWGQDRTSPFAADGVTWRLCGLLPNYFGHLLLSSLLLSLLLSFLRLRERLQSIVMSTSVCLCVCVSVCEDISGTTPQSVTNFCACCLWPWLDPSLASLWYVMYFQFCGSHYVLFL